MGWQAPHYIYPQVEQPDYAGSLIKGSVAGATMGMKISDRMQEKALQNDIAAAWKAGEAKVADIDAKHAEAIAAVPHEQSFVKQPDQAAGMTAGIKAGMGVKPELVANTELAPKSLSVNPGANQITGDKALMMAGVTPTPGVLSPSEKATETQIMADVATKEPAALTKLQEEYKTKRIEAKAGTWNDLYGVYMKHGKVKEALEIENKYFDQVVKVASLDHKAGTKLWNNGPLKDKYGEIDLTPKPKFKVVGDHGSYIKVNETTGEVTPIKSVGELKSLDPTHNVYMKVTNKDGSIEWKQVQFGKQKEPTGDNLRKFKNEKGEEVTEELVNGKWVQKATSPAKEPKEDSVPKLKAREEALKNRFLREYGGATDGDIDSGKLNFEKMMAEKGKTIVINKDGSPKLDSKGNKITLNTFYDTIAQYHMSQPDDITDAERTNNTLRFGQDFGTTAKKAVDLKLTPEQSVAVKNQTAKIVTKADGSTVYRDASGDTVLFAAPKTSAPKEKETPPAVKKASPSVVKSAEASVAKQAAIPQVGKKGYETMIISMTGGENLKVTTNVVAADAIKEKMKALDKLVRQGGLTPKQRDAELRSYAQSYM